MTSVNVYLNFNGNCEEAFLYYKSIFGGEFSYMGRFKDMPASPEYPPVTGPEANRIMHVGLPISKETAIMGSDTGGEWAKSFQQGNNFSISVSTDSKDEANRIFNALADGGNVIMPMNKTFWGDYFGMCSDKFHINWMVSYSENQQKM